jgi:hypothetical protein
MLLQRCQEGLVNSCFDFRIADGQNGKGVYSFFYNDLPMIKYYSKNNETVHTFKIDKKYIKDLSKKNMDYWEIQAFIYNNPQYKAFIFKHKGFNIPTSKEILITDSNIVNLQN